MPAVAIEFGSQRLEAHEEAVPGRLDRLRQLVRGTHRDSEILAARGLDALPGDPVALGAEQQRDRLTDVIWQPRPSERGLGCDGLVELGVVPDPTAPKVRLDGTGSDDIDGDLAGAE